MCIWKVSPEDRHCDYCVYGNGCEERPSRREGFVMTKIRALDIGEFCFFPLSRWDTCRTATSTIKKIYGAVYKTTRVEDRIMVERIS